MITLSREATSPNRISLGFQARMRCQVPGNFSSRHAQGHATQVTCTDPTVRRTVTLFASRRRDSRRIALKRYVVAGHSVGECFNSVSRGDRIPSQVADPVDNLCGDRRWFLLIQPHPREIPETRPSLVRPTLADQKSLLPTNHHQCLTDFFERLPRPHHRYVCGEIFLACQTKVCHRADFATGGLWGAN